MKKLFFVILVIISCASLYGVDLSNRNMTLHFNGHDHLVFDPLSYKIEKAYLRNKSSIEDTIETVFRTETGIENFTAILPVNITAFTFNLNTTSDTGVIKIKIENCHLQYPNTNETPVVFKSADVVVTANLKAPLISSCSSAFSNNSQRVIVISDTKPNRHMAIGA